MTDTAPPRRFLFVCGVPRSGTTALTRILTAHPRIAIGMERFRLRARRIAAGEFTPALFERDRFFDFRDQDTNIRFDGFYRRLADRWDGARFVGDKIPQLYRDLPALDAQFGEPDIVYILRGIAGVARSWNARADDPDDSWPAENDYRRAVEEWNRANRLALTHYRAAPKRVHLVEYERLFPFGIHVVAALLHRLGLDLEQQFLRDYATFAKGARRPRGDADDQPGQAEYLEAHADEATFGRLRWNALR